MSGSRYSFLDTDAPTSAPAELSAEVTETETPSFSSSTSVQEQEDAVCPETCRAQLCSADDSQEVIRLKFLTEPLAHWITEYAEAFQAAKAGAVAIDIVELPFNQLFGEIINEATRQAQGVYDGFVTPPTITGSVVEYDGWADLTSYIQETSERTAGWSDILLGYRQYVAQYQGKIIMFPLDGDLLHLFYRKDVLQHFNLDVPRTWDEYTKVAAATHGQVFNNVTLTGSCIGRKQGSVSEYWANLLLSSVTQYQGQWSGHLFDTADMKPLAGPAMELALKWMEEQVMYGPDDEFERSFDLNIDNMLEGNCVLTYNWGNSFKQYLREGSVLRGDKYGVAMTPGSPQVLDRDSNKLVECTKGLCQHGQYYDDIGYVNRAPYLAFGGWACAVNNYTDPVKKRLAEEFCAFASDTSLPQIIPNATSLDGSIQGQDPFRVSHLNVNDYVAQGFERNVTEEYIESIRLGLRSPNVVTDIRFPKASDLNKVLDEEFHDYLLATKYGNVADPASARREVVENIERQWKNIIDTHNREGSTRVPILDQYQRLRGVYTQNVDLNQINKIRMYGMAMSILSMLCSVVFAAWAIKYRKTPVVRASQPLFLVMICFGAVVLVSAIIPLGIDDSVATEKACSRACMAVPWLLTLGWTIVFSALFAKLRRVNLVYKNSIEFKRVQVKETDVLLPFALLFTWNATLLLVWTIAAPLVWDRHIDPDDELSSLGSCRANNSNAWKVCLALIGVSNGLALILANVEAYKARLLSTEYGESRYIAMAMGSIMQVVLIAVPLYFLVRDDPSVSYFVLSSIVFIVAMSIQMLIFVPKILVWWLKPNERIPLSAASNASNRGLSVKIFRSQDVVGNNINSVVHEAVAQELADYKKKTESLRQSLQETGLDADAFFDSVGLPTQDHEQAQSEPGRERVRPRMNLSTLTEDGFASGSLFTEDENKQ